MTFPVSVLIFKQAEHSRRRLSMSRITEERIGEISAAYLHIFGVRGPFDLKNPKAIFNLLVEKFYLGDQPADFHSVLKALGNIEGFSIGYEEAKKFSELLQKAIALYGRNVHEAN